MFDFLRCSPASLKTFCLNQHKFSHKTILDESKLCCLMDHFFPFTDAGVEAPQKWRLDSSPYWSTDPLLTTAVPASSHLLGEEGCIIISTAQRGGWVTQRIHIGYLSFTRELRPPVRSRLSGKAVRSALPVPLSACMPLAWDLFPWNGCFLPSTLDVIYKVDTFSWDVKCLVGTRINLGWALQQPHWNKGCACSWEVGSRDGPRWRWDVLRVCVGVCWAVGADPELFPWDLSRAPTSVQPGAASLQLSDSACHAAGFSVHSPGLWFSTRAMSEASGHLKPLGSPGKQTNKKKSSFGFVWVAPHGEGSAK